MSTYPEPVTDRRLRNPQLGPHANKREERRYSFTLPVIVLGIDGGGHVFWEVTPTQNVSWHGCQLHLKTRPQGQMLLALQLVPRSDDPIQGAHHALYEIVWTRESKGGCHVGARAVGEVSLLSLAFGKQK